MDDALFRLSIAAGLEAGYWDGLGTRRDLTADTARSLLRSLGYDPGGDCEAQRRALDEAPFRSPLPRVALTQAGAAPVVEVALPTGHAASPVAWTIRAEDGRIFDGDSMPERLDHAGTRDIDGTAIGRFRLSLDTGEPLAAGYHRFELPAHGAACRLIAAPPRCYVPESLEAGGRVWGLAVQLYSLRSARNWGVGDFTDLARLANLAGRAGAALIGLNPLHARHLARPEEASPYAPSSRLTLDAMYLDAEAIAEYADCEGARALVASAPFQARLAAARAAPLVNHAAVAALKLPVLRLLHARFRAAAPQARRAALRDFIARGGIALERFATFEALRLWLLARDGHLPGWRDWAGGWRDPDSAAVRGFRLEHAEDIEFQHYLQWQAEEQLAAAAAAARDAGMPVGLYRDLAVGAADDGAECWGNQGLIAPGASVGAPPDLLNREGQDWGLPPWNPRAVADAGYVPFQALLEANMRAAGALRIDHVMALTRLFWIPAGMGGAAGGYVRNAFDMLSAIVALESARRRCLVIGEDLGSVPDGFREALAARGLLSYRVLLFERHWDGDGSFKRPHEYPAAALATVVTHDMPTLAEYWAGGDIARRDALGLFPDPALRDAESARRGPERSGLMRVLEDTGLVPADRDDAGAVRAALHALVGHTSAMLALVQLDDIGGETDPVNIPGTYREYPNWRRKLSLPIEELEADPRWLALAEAMRAAGRNGS
jgi:4-alpha-glucanotransferase